MRKNLSHYVNVKHKNKTVFFSYIKRQRQVINSQKKKKNPTKYFIINKQIMNQIFIFVFILLAALSLVNAMPHELRKRTTTFEKCTNSELADVPLLDVKISPDPVFDGASMTFTVSVTLK